MMLDKKICIGILGGGQLARMSAYEAFRLGFDIAILEKTKSSPAGQLTKNEFVGWVENKKTLEKFAGLCDVITLENEFVDYHYLEFLEALGKKVFPSSKTISLIQDKLIQKQTLKSHKIAVPAFVEVGTETEFKKIKEALGLPFVLKSRKMGYDGYGNALIRNEKEFRESFKRLTSRHSNLYAEKFIRFTDELALMVVRTRHEIKTYEVVKTVQKNHICHTVIAPAELDSQIVLKAKKLGVQAVKAVDGYGIFGIEFFLAEDGEVLVNEMAPRPHNSGHYTIEACYASQFENHIRSVLNLPLGSTEMIKKYAVMINLLGKKNGAGVVDNYDVALKDPHLFLHVYGKAESRIGRKMGHITILGDDLEPILNKARKLEKKIML